MRRQILLSRFFLPHISRLVRTRVAIGCSFFIQGLVFATWCARIPNVREALGLSEGALGALLLTIPVGQLVSMAPNGALVARLGSRRMLVTAGFCYPVVLIGLGLATSLWQLTVLLFAAGWVANLSNTAANTQGVQLEHYYRRRILALFHGMWSLAGLVGVGIAMIFGLFHMSTWLHFLLVALGAMCLLSFSGGALMGFDRSGGAGTEAPKGCLGGWKLTPFIFWIGIASLGCMACEGTIYDWSGIYFRDVLRAAPAHQNYGYFGYLCTMVAGRFVADRIVNRHGVKRVLYGCGVCISGGLTLALCFSWCAPWLATLSAVIGFALVGCGTSAVVPMCCSLAGRAKGLLPSIAIAEVSTIGFFGFLAAPPMIGGIAHVSSLRVSFAVMALVGLLVIVATWCLRRDLAKD